MVSGSGLRAHALLSTVTLCLLSLSAHCFLSPSQIGAKAGEHWHFCRGCVTSSRQLCLIFLYFHFCAGIQEKGGEGFDLLVLLTWPFPLWEFLSVLLSFIKAVVCLCAGKTAKDKCQADYFKLVKLNIGRNKHEMICTKTTISDASGVDVQYWRSSGRREKMWGDDF